MMLISYPIPPGHNKGDTCFYCNAGIFQRRLAATVCNKCGFVGWIAGVPFAWLWDGTVFCPSTAYEDSIVLYLKGVHGLSLDTRQGMVPNAQLLWNPNLGVMFAQSAQVIIYSSVSPN